MYTDKTPLNQVIGDNISLVYQQPDMFSKYHSIYHSQKYCDYYFRVSPKECIEKAKYLDCGYFITRDGEIIGGAFLKPNYMSDLFIVPPYKDYNMLAEQLIQYLKSISNKGDSILLQDVVEEHKDFYESKGFCVQADGYWMTRPTELLDVELPKGYTTKSIVDDDKDEIASVIMAAYEANPSMMSVDSHESYVQHVEYVIKHNMDNKVLHDSSRIVVYEKTKEIVGLCLHMEFEKLPLIMSFVVRPDHQGIGLGSYLLSHSISCSSKKYSATRLYVDNHNEAIAVYEHMGFIKNKTLSDLTLII